MNIVCLICSELLKYDDIISTNCGHIFHRNCISDWIKNCPTCPMSSCPTCRSSITSSNLIKLYFEVDDNKASLNMEEILRTNDDLTQENKQLRLKESKLESDLKEMEVKLSYASNKANTLERQKQLDDMAIAGFKSIKVDTTNEIIKLSLSLESVKLDLLAEKQLRRIHQKTLRTLDPENENYNPDSIKDIKENEPTPSASVAETNGSLSEASSNFEVPFWKLNCEAKPTIIQPSKVTSSASYILPCKIQKGAFKDSNNRLASFRHQRSLWNNSNPKPLGYQFVKDFDDSSSDPVPSTSASILNKFHKRMFGEGGSFPIPPTATTTPTETSNSIVFSFSKDVPMFSTTSSPSSSSASSSQRIISTPFRNYRENTGASPSQSKLVQASKEGGPKSSDR